MSDPRTPGRRDLSETSAEERRIGRRELDEVTSGGPHPVRRLALWVSRTVGSNAVFFGTAAIGAVIVAIATVAASVIYDGVEDGDGVSDFDQPALRLALSLRQNDLDRYLTWFTHLGGPLGMTIIAGTIMIIMVWRWRSRTPAVLMIITVAGSLLLTVVGKTVIGRVRPPQADAVPPYETSPSFPSGHALNSTAIAGIVAYLVVIHLHRRLAKIITITVAVVWAVAIGLSRVFLGHHWMTDVMVGWALGLAWLGAVVTSHRLFLVTRAARAEKELPRLDSNQQPAG